MNSWKFLRWVWEATLSEAETMKLAYISRKIPLNPSSVHGILAVQSIKPQDFASQLNMNVGNGWGVFKSFVDIFMHADDGRYLILKDPNAPKLKIYKVPDEEKLEGFDAIEDFSVAGH